MEFCLKNIFFMLVQSYQPKFVPNADTLPPPLWNDPRIQGFLWSVVVVVGALTILGGIELIRCHGFRNLRLRQKLQFILVTLVLVSVQIGFVAVPYFMAGEEMSNEVSSFLTRLIVIYIIVLFLALLVSLYIAREVTRPLSQVITKMKSFRLGGKDQKITYEHNDELGDLVRHYNSMVDFLEQSSRKLALSEREGAWRTMARQIAHEINNPLTPMKLSIQYLQSCWTQEAKSLEEKGALNPTYDEYFRESTQMLVEQIDQLSRIAGSFSTFAKMPEVHVDEVDVAEKLSQVIALFEHNDQNIPVRYVGPDQGVVAYADQKQIGQVFTNILKNALQAIGEREGGDVIVLLKDMDEYVEISFSDNGPGIPEEVQEKIFMPNFTTKSTGTGLGLAISKNIVEGCEGKICFETSKKGTIFFVHLRKKQ